MTGFIVLILIYKKDEWLLASIITASILAYCMGLSKR